jgi:signal transduction histidine kinase
MYVEVSVADSGVGISEKELSMVFNKYETTEAGKNAALKGTGLGLAICREIIDLHQGEIWVESKLGEGSTFYFTLPIRPIKLKN